MTSLSLGFQAAGLIVLYSLYGLLQERILKGHYGPEGERFTSAPMLVLCNRLFSLTVGIAIVLYKSSRRSVGSASFLKRIKPASPIYAYCAVALLNFSATFCQYEALKYVGFTTQALAKTIKMVPVLVISTLIYKKSHKARQWIAASVVLLGCATYLTSRPDPRASQEAQHSTLDGLIGAALLIGYLGLDGLTSTTQEKVFGRNENSADPFGDGSPVLDQMVWVNLFASLISLVGAILSFPVTIHSIGLIITTPALVMDIMLLSGCAALGLIVLLNTIAAFGALTSSTIMTCRQFLSILINAGVFGNFTSVGLQGWLGVGWVASGIYIKMDRSWDEKKPNQVALPLSESNSEHPSEKESLLEAGSPASPDEDIPIQLPSKTSPGLIRYMRQYGPPLLVPILLAMAVSYTMPMLASVGISNVNSSSTNMAPMTIPSQPIDLSQVMSDEEEQGDLTMDYATESGKSEEQEAVSTGDDYKPETAADVQVEGGLWAHEVHSALAPHCEGVSANTSYFPDPIPFTVLATYPRSGNSYIRNLVERGSGYRTSSVYCDRVLAETFLGECSRDGFLRKSHYPVNRVRDSNINTPDHWKQFDRQVHLVRNPIDAVASYWHFRHTQHSHEGRVNLTKFGDNERYEILRLTHRWLQHAVYWEEQAQIPTHFIRYEDLRSNPLTTLMALLSFLLPSDKLPSMETLACTVQVDESKEAYHSRKSSFFSAWDSYEPYLRNEILIIVQDKFCRYGYDTMLKDVRGETPIDCSALRHVTLPGQRRSLRKIR